jgi:hypothetical protein
VELPISSTVIEVSLDEILLTSSGKSPMPHSHAAEVSTFHMIFNLNKFLIATHFDKGFHIVILCLRLKEFLEKCLVQFQVYIRFIA